MPHGCRQHQLHISHSQSKQDSMSLPPGVDLTLSSILERQPHSSGGQRPFSHSLLHLLPKVVLAQPFHGVLLSGALLLTLCCPVKWALLDYGPFSPLSDFRISRAIRLIWDSSVLVFQRFVHIWRVCTSTINWELHLFQSG